MSWELRAAGIVLAVTGLLIVAAAVVLAVSCTTGAI